MPQQVVNATTGFVAGPKEAMAGLGSHANPCPRDPVACFLSTRRPARDRKWTTRGRVDQNAANIRMHLTGGSGLCPPPQAGDAGRSSVSIIPRNFNA